MQSEHVTFNDLNSHHLRHQLLHLITHARTLLIAEAFFAVALIFICVILFFGGKSPPTIDEQNSLLPRSNVDRHHQAAADDLLKSVIAERVAAASKDGVRVEQQRIVDDAGTAAAAAAAGEQGVGVGVGMPIQHDSAARLSATSKYEDLLSSKTYRTLSSNDMRSMRGSPTASEVVNCVVCRHLTARVLEALVDPSTSQLDAAFAATCDELPRTLPYAELRARCRTIMEVVHTHLSESVRAKARRARAGKTTLSAAAVVEALQLCHSPLMLCRRSDAAPALRFATADDFVHVVDAQRKTIDDVGSAASASSDASHHNGSSADHVNDDEFGVAHFDGRVASIYALGELVLCCYYDCGAVI